MKENLSEEEKEIIFAQVHPYAIENKKIVGLKENGGVRPMPAIEVFSREILKHLLFLKKKGNPGS